MLDGASPSDVLVHACVPLAKTEFVLGGSNHRKARRYLRCAKFTGVIQPSVTIRRRFTVSPLSASGNGTSYRCPPPLASVPQPINVTRGPCKTAFARRDFAVAEETRL